VNRHELKFIRRWGDLSAYNSERARGILHDAETDARMAEKQREYNAEHVREMREEGWTSVGDGMWKKATPEPWWRRWFR
jgi:hypothetical protein